MKGSIKEDAPKLDWSPVSRDYLQHRPGYPEEFFVLLRQLGIGLDGQDILDLGSGTGALAVPFARQGARVTAVDLSEGQIEAGKEAADRHGVKIKFMVAPSEKTGLPDHSFDAITASMCWGYFDINAMKGEVPRLLRPGGKLLVSTLIWEAGKEGIIRFTDDLIAKYNPKAKRGAHTGHSEVIPEWSQKWLKLVTYHEFLADIPFTRESWRGRIRACAWIGAALPKEKTEAFDREHAALLEERTPAKFDVPHRITIRIFELTAP
jgi:ubiquinone/menaquinone biosynthesis C-methylase UbiE